ncbi:hypothetical protein BGZ73_008481 [Actinomortierella ambigua]|nr:hypothetical protein BGZ73_008481 [Actinomortierella ambigua]
MSGTFVVSNMLDAIAPRSSIHRSNSSISELMQGKGAGTSASGRSDIAGGGGGGGGGGPEEKRTSRDHIPWPAKQRRRIDRIRDEKWGEFVKTINDQFEWLETYYQGCVAAASLQRKHELEHDDEQHQQRHDQSSHTQQDVTNNLSSWASSGGSHDPNTYMTPEQNRRHDFLATPPARHPIFSTPLAASASLNATLFPSGRHPTTPDRHTRRTTPKMRRNPRSPFHRATTISRATSPGSPLAGFSPRRTIKITPRRLRVDSSATARRIGREKQARQHSLGLQPHRQKLQQQGQQHYSRVSDAASREDVLSSSLSDIGAKAVESEGGRDSHMDTMEMETEMEMDVSEEGDHQLVPFSTTTPSKRPERRHQQQHFELKTPLNDTMAPSDTMAAAPSSSKRSKSLLQSARTLETTVRSHRAEETDRSRDPSLSAMKRSTPGSKARDSLGRVSPHYRALLRSGGDVSAGSGRSDHSIRTEPVPGLRRGNHATATASSSVSAMSIVSSAIKRDSSNLLERHIALHGDDDDEGNNGDEGDDQGGAEEGHTGRHAFKRARRPSFHDSTAPVRFESPEKELNSKSSRLSLEEQRVFGSGRVSRTRTTGGSGYEADLSSSATPDMIDMAMTTPGRVVSASAKGQMTDLEQGIHAYEEEDAGYDSRMSAATVVRPSETHRDTMRVPRIRPSLAESFEVIQTAEDEELAPETSFASTLSSTTTKARTTATAPAGAHSQHQQTQRQRLKDPSTTIASTSRLNSLKTLGRSTSTSTTAAHQTSSMDDEATDFHDLHKDLPPPSTVTNYLRQGRSVSSTDLLSSTSAGAASRGAGIFSRVSNLNLRPGGLKRTVSAMETSHSSTGSSSTTTACGSNTGAAGSALTQLKPRHFPLALAEKRPLSTRRPIVTQSGTGSSNTSQLMSRLLKSGANLTAPTAMGADGSRTSSALQHQQQQQSSSSAVATAATTAAASARPSAIGASSSANAAPRSTTPIPTSSSSSTTSSTLMRPTESSLARAAELQGAKRSIMGGSTGTGSSSILPTSSSVKSKAPVPITAPSLVRPQPSKTKTVAPLAPPPPPATQATVLPEIGSDVEDHDQDGDDPFPPLKSALTVVAAVKGASTATATAISSHSSSSNSVVVGSSSTSFTSSSVTKLTSVSKSSKNPTSKDAMTSSATTTSSTAMSSKAKVEKTKAKPAKAPAPTTSTTTTTTATTTTTTTATTSSSTASSSTSKELPAWAQWDNLEEAMKRQRHVNPRTIFGSLPVLDMNDMFPGNEAKFRARTSSAHWGNADRLTEAEAQKYREEMGWE